jgi:LCP family protein required for cell wall assembly
VPPPVAPPPGGPPQDPEPPRRRRWGWRMVAGCLIAVLAATGAAAVFTLEEVHTLRDALNQNAPLNISAHSLANAGWGDPQTLLLVGNDQRKRTTTTPVLPHSNEMLLVRLDPGKPWISMMSIPRELMVPIHTPGGIVTTRLNAALTYGGIPLLVTTIKQLTGLSVNHVVEIDFNHFVKAVNEIGCVYSTVDRRYYHVNVPGGAQYQEINLQPGYQRLCGQEALEFVSYRHGDTSLVRDARDQAFLLDVKKQYGPTLVDNAHRFEFVFGRTVQTDSGLHSTNGLLNLLGTLVASVSKPVRQVQFAVNLQPTGANPCSCDTATPQQIKSSVHSFLYGANKQPKAHIAAVAHSVHSSKAINRLPLVNVPSQQLGRAHQIARRVPFGLEFPRVQDKGGTGVPPYLLSYVVHAPGGVNYPAYVAAFSAGQLGQFYDVQGTPWTTQPELDSPDQALKVGGRTYYLYYSGQHLRIVAWYDQNDVYWVHNTLSDALGNGELLAIAEQTSPITGSRTLAARARVSLRAAHIPLRLSTTSTLSLRQKIGAIAALVAVPLLLVLAFLLLRRRRDVRGVRERLAVGLTSSVRLAPAGGWAVAGAAGLGAGPAGNGGPAGARRIRPGVVLAAILILLAGAGMGLALTFAGSRVVHGTRHSRTHHKLRPGALVPPAVPVIILNSTPVPDAAHRLSTGLRSHGVKVAGVGNIPGPRPAGLEVLYAPNQRTQARRLAALLSGRHPSIAPIDPAAAGAAGSHAKLVVVIG